MINFTELLKGLSEADASYLFYRGNYEAITREVVAARIRQFVKERNV